MGRKSPIAVKTQKARRMSVIETNHMLDGECGLELLTGERHKPIDSFTMVKSDLDPYQLLEHNLKRLNQREFIITRVKNKQASKTKHKKFINRDLAIVTLGCATGLRVTAITEIDIHDIDFDNNTIHVIEKNKKGKEIYIGEGTMSVIKDWITDRNELIEGFPDNDALFISVRRTRLDVSSVRRMISKYSAGIDKHITPHKMRSTCATNLYKKTGDIYLVQQQLGHKNISNTRKYTTIGKEDKIKAANILDSLFL